MYSILLNISDVTVALARQTYVSNMKSVSSDCSSYDFLTRSVSHNNGLTANLFYFGHNICSHFAA